MININNFGALVERHEKFWCVVPLFYRGIDNNRDKSRSPYGAGRLRWEIYKINIRDLMGFERFRAIIHNW